MDVFHPGPGEIIQEFPFQTEELRHGRRHAGYIGLHIGHVGIVFLAGQAHGVEDPVRQAAQVQVRTGLMDHVFRDIPLDIRFVAVHHVVRDPQHVPQRIVPRFRDRVADRQLRHVPLFLRVLRTGFLHAFDIPDHSLFIRSPVNGQEFISAHPVDMIRFAQVVHQEHRHVGDVAVPRLMAVQAVHAPQVVDIDKHEDKRAVPVLFELSVIFGHVVLIPGAGAQSAQGVHHDLPFQHGRRVFKRKEERDRDRRDGASCKQEFADLRLDHFRQDQQEQHRQQDPFEMPADRLPVDKDAGDCHGKVDKGDNKADHRCGTEAGFCPVQLHVFDFQYRRKQEHAVNDHRHKLDRAFDPLRFARP